MIKLYSFIILLTILSSCGTRIPTTEKRAARKLSKLSTKIEQITNVYPDLIDSVTQIKYNDVEIQPLPVTFTESIINFDSLKTNTPCDTLVQIFQREFIGTLQYEDSLINISIERNDQGRQTWTYKIKNQNLPTKVITPTVSPPKDKIPWLIPFVVGLVLGILGISISNKL